MKRWLKEHSSIIISLVLTGILLTGGAILDHFNTRDSHLMTFSEMEELADEYKAARDAKREEVRSE